MGKHCARCRQCGVHPVPPLSTCCELSADPYTPGPAPPLGTTESTLPAAAVGRQAVAGAAKRASRRVGDSQAAAAAAQAAAVQAAVMATAAATAAVAARLKVWTDGCSAVHRSIAQRDVLLVKWSSQRGSIAR